MDIPNSKTSRGAALSKLPGHAVVTSRCATKHYGVSANYVHDPCVDAGMPISKVSRDGKKRTKRVGLNRLYHKI